METQLVLQPGAQRVLHRAAPAVRLGWRVTADPTDLPGLVRQVWTWLAADEQRDVTRLFFDAITRRLTDPDNSPWADFASTSVQDWQDVLRRAALEAGQDEHSATAHPTLYLAALRGLLLDLHATRDRLRWPAATEQLSSCRTMLVHGHTAATRP